MHATLQFHAKYWRPIPCKMFFLCHGVKMFLVSLLAKVVVTAYQLDSLLFLSDY